MKLDRLIILVLLFTAIGSLRPARAQQTLVLDSLIAEARRNNPELLAARHKAGASAARVDQASSWESPQIGMEFYQTPTSSFPNPARHSMENDYYVQQMIPFPGKLSAMGRAAESEASMASQDYAALENKVIRDLKSAYYELYLVQRKIQLNAENQSLMKSFVEIARKQYEVGMGQQADILRAQTEYSTLVTDGVNLQREKRVTESMLNTLLNRPAEAPLDSVPGIVRESPQWTFDQLKPIALANRPELASMKAGVAMREAELSAAHREYWPDIMTRLMYKNMVGSTQDFWSAMVGISIPLAPWSGGKVTSRVEETELNVQKAEADRAAMENMVLYEVQRALVGVETNRNLLQLASSTSIPQAEQTLQSTVASYQAGKTEFLMVIDAYRMVLEAKLDYEMAIMNEMTSQAQLEQAVGRSIEEISAELH